jgi:hypothetical protein
VIRSRTTEAHKTIDLTKLSRVKESVPANDLAPAECDFANVRVLALALAEPGAPPTIRRQAEASAAMITGLMLFHHALAQQLTGISLR